jgi:hypothetical protein
MSYEIAPLKGKDVEESVKLLQILGSQASEIFLDPRALGQTIYGPHAITLIAKEKEKIVDVIHGTATIPPNIVLLVTQPKAGLWSTLVNKFLDHVRIQLPSVKAVRTNLPADMPEIVGFYSSKGFVVEGFVKAGAQGRDLVFLQKSLAHQTTPVA